jgi:selenocysteine lyase/cysteine desulfurase
VRFDKSEELFPIRKRYVYLSSCGVSPLYGGALARVVERAHEQAESTPDAVAAYLDPLESLRANAARLLRTEPANVSYHRNTSEAISMIAAGYPFEPGDQVLSYVDEYPANHYPWRNLAGRGVELVQLANVTTPGNEHCGERPCAFSFEELEARLTERTRVVALSHVQFTSGYALDLAAVAALCRERGADLVLDVAQSLGAQPVNPEEHGVAALAGSGWKWLLGPWGSALMYTSPEFRSKLRHVLVGAEMMQQGFDYLDHSWQPHETAKQFEFSTSSPPLVAGLDASISEVHLRYGPEAIRNEIFRLQDIFLSLVDAELVSPVIFTGVHRSGILALDCRRREPDAIARDLLEHGFVCSVRAGYLRFAPHFYVTDEEIVRFAETLNRLAC